MENVNPGLTAPPSDRQGAHFDDEVVGDDAEALDTQAEPYRERNPGDDP